jgi:hypothetical protein
MLVGIGRYYTQWFGFCNVVNVAGMLILKGLIPIQEVE